MNDLEIKGMKLEIAINCKERREEDLSCEDCAKCRKYGVFRTR